MWQANKADSGKTECFCISTGFLYVTVRLLADVLFNHHFFQHNGAIFVVFLNRWGGLSFIQRCWWQNASALDDTERWLVLRPQRTIVIRSVVPGLVLAAQSMPLRNGYKYESWMRTFDIRPEEKSPERRRFSPLRLGSFRYEKGARENYPITRTKSAFLSDAHHRSYVESSHPGILSTV